MRQWLRKLTSLTAMLAISIGTTAFLPGCDDEPEPGDAIEDAADSTEDALDDAEDAVEDAADDAADSLEN